MHVLEDAVGVRRHVDAEELLHPRVPDLRQVLERDRPGDQLLLELEAEDDVQRVRRLVGVDADQARLGAVDRADERVEVDVAELARERLLQWFVPIRPERPAAADEVLPGPALRLVDRERRGSAERRAHQRVGDAVGVEAVARLVQRRPDRLEVVGPVARRQPHVAVRERGAERVCGRVEAPGAFLEAERRERPARRSGAAHPGRRRRAGTKRRPRGALRTSSVSAGRRTANTSRTSVVVIPGS